MEERDAHPSDHSLSQAYRDADHPEPSPALDARILDAARQAVAGPAVRKRSRWFAWALPISTAAVLVLGLTVLLEVQHQAPEYLQPPGEPAATAGPGADAAPEPLPAESTVRVPYQVPAETMRQSEAAQSEEPPVKALERAPERKSSAPWSAADSIPEPQPFRSPSREAPAVPPTPQPAAKAEPRPLPQAAPMAAQDAAEAPSSLAGQSAARMTAPPPASAAAPGQESAPAFSFSQGLSKRKAVAPVTERPEQLVESIRRLLREGRVEEARKELEKLRGAYPGFALPEDMKGL